MKVCFIFRQPKPKRYSIENVFNTIIRELKLLGFTTYSIYHNGNISETINSAKSTKADIYHITGDVHYLSLFLPRKKTLLTIHDIGNFINYQKTTKRILYYLIWFRLPILYLKKITVVSASTFYNITDLISSAKNKIKIVNNPLTLSLGYSYRKPSEMPKILQIGSGSHKNLKNLILAVKNLNCEIFIVGEISIDNLQLLNKFQIRYKNWVDLKQEELEKIYEQVDILYFASFTEGFGLPIIEAQTAGIPVLTSAISPMREVSGGWAKLVSPHSILEIQEAILSLMEDSTERKIMVKKGFENACKYSPQRIALDYINIYKSLHA